MPYYDLKAVYNPLEEDITVVCSSPAINSGEDYVIKAGGILLLPETVAQGVASTIAREVLRKAGKEFDDPSKLKIEQEVLSHKFEIQDITKGGIKEETPKKGGRK